MTSSIVFCTGQVAKQALANRVVDEELAGRRYTHNELSELFTFEPKPASAATAAALAVPNDEVRACLQFRSSVSVWVPRPDSAATAAALAVPDDEVRACLQFGICAFIIDHIPTGRGPGRP